MTDWATERSIVHMKFWGVVSGAAISIAIWGGAGCGGTSNTGGAGGLTSAGGVGAIIVAGSGGTGGSTTAADAGGTSGTAVAGGTGGTAVAGGYGGTAVAGGSGGTVASGTGGSGGLSVVVGFGGAGGKGHGSGGSTGIPSSSLGLSCGVDADCGAGLVCLLSNGTGLATGGPANGMCTQVCDQTADGCSTIEVGAACVSFDGSNTGVCLEACTLGAVADLSTKCQGRADFLCADLAPTGATPAPFCVPLCQSDAQCAGGTFCSPKSGLCEKTKPTGNPVGTPCDPNATTDNCRGFCLQTSAQGATVTGACTEFCSAGTECFYNGTKPGGFCAHIPQGAGLLDLGICESSCNCDKDCPFPGDVCQSWFANAGSLKSDLASAGFCFPNATGATELTCGGGGSGGGG